MYSINIVLLPGIDQLKNPTQFQSPEGAPEFILVALTEQPFILLYSATTLGFYGFFTLGFLFLSLLLFLSGRLGLFI